MLANIDFEGVRVTIVCRGECGERFSLLLDTTNKDHAKRLLFDDVLDRKLSEFAAVLGWEVEHRGSLVTADVHWCPACKAKRAA